MTEKINTIRSFFSWNYFVGILSGKRSFRSILAVFLLSLILSIYPSIKAFTTFYPIVKNLEKTTFSIVNQVYPSELEVKLKSGIASTNVTEPYFVKVDKELFENILSIKDVKKRTNSSTKMRILAIDTKATADDFEKYQSYALLTKNSLVTYSRGEIKITPLREVPDITINKEFIVKKIKELNKNNKIVNILYASIYISPLLIVLGQFIFFLVALFLTAVAVWIMVKINQLKIGFKQIYRYSVAVSLLPTLIQNILLYIPGLPIAVRGASVLFDILIFGLCYYGLILFKKGKPNAKNN